MASFVVTDTLLPLKPQHLNDFREMDSADKHLNIETLFYIIWLDPTISVCVDLTVPYGPR